jgi:molecular chaperone HscA
MFLVDGSVHALRKAGNEVDRMLREYILAQAKNQHEGLDASVLARIKAALSLRQRDMKEGLFKTGRTEFALTDDTKGAVELKDFLAEESVQRFSEELREAFREALAGIDESWLRECAHGRVVVVATGGSSTLPMVQDLARLEFLVRSAKVTCSVGVSIPAWITRDYPELVDEYPQLAVALGGSSRNLPEMSERTFDSFRGLTDQGKWFIPPAYKGS